MGWGSRGAEMTDECVQPDAAEFTSAEYHFLPGETRSPDIRALPAASGGGKGVLGSGRFFWADGEAPLG